MITYWRFVPFISRRMLVGWGFNLELSFQRSFVTGWGQLKERGCPNVWSRLSWFLWNQVSEVDGWGWVRGLDLFEAMVTNTDSLLLSVPLPEEWAEWELYGALSYMILQLDVNSRREGGVGMLLIGLGLWDQRLSRLMVCAHLWGHLSPEVTLSSWQDLKIQELTFWSMAADDSVHHLYSQPFKDTTLWLPRGRRSSCSETNPRHLWKKSSSMMNPTASFLALP